ncbi:hypothetical protein ABE527_19285 [Brucella sp. TWI432]
MTNFGSASSSQHWPVPNPKGFQIAEIGNIATSLLAIDVQMKATETALSNHKHSFAELLDRPTTLGGYGITDGMTATQVAAAIQQAVSDLVNGSGAALDTLKELADALGNDPQFAATVSAALGLRLRVDAAQAFTLAQKAQGRSNLDALGIVDKGKADGVASLDSTGKVPTGQLPAMNYLPLTGGRLTGSLQVDNEFISAGSGSKRGVFRNTGAGDSWINFFTRDQTWYSEFGQRANGAAYVWLNGQEFRFQTNGTFVSPVDIVAKGWLYAGDGSSRLESNGNVVGAVWSNWGSSDAYTAIFNRIEKRAQEYADDRANTVRGEVWWRARDWIAAAGVGEVGTYAVCKCINETPASPGDLIDGSRLQYSSTDYGAIAQSPTGTWRMMRYAKTYNSAQRVSLFKRAW